jgi:hypothetical protein
VLTNRTLARINNRPREVGRRPLVVVGAGTLAVTALAALAFALGMAPYFAPLAVLGGGAVLALLLYLRQKAKMTVSLPYKKGKLDGEVASRFSKVREALEGLSSSEGVWTLPVSSEPPKGGEVGPMPERDTARVGLLPTPGIKADVPIWGIEAGEGTLFFFPEGTLLYRNDRYEPLSYDALEMALSSGRFFEEDLPDDATVVDTVWRFSRPDGSPDPRHKNENAEIPVVMYNVLDVTGPSGLDFRLMVSNRRAAARFARVFGAKDLREKPSKNTGGSAGTASAKERNGREEKPKSAEEIEQEARLARARKALGVAKGASAEEIGAAYRELARTHHPDKVASLESEVREYSEERMKEINAAYAVLRGGGGSIARGRRPA